MCPTTWTPSRPGPVTACERFARVPAARASTSPACCAALVMRCWSPASLAARPETPSRATSGHRGCRLALTRIAAESRRTVSVVSRSTGDATLFNEPGPPVSDAEWELLLDRRRQARAIRRGRGAERQPATRLAIRCVRPVGAGGPCRWRAGHRRRRRERPGARPPGRSRMRSSPMPRSSSRRPASMTPPRRRQWLRDRGAGSVIATFGADGIVAITPGRCLARVAGWRTSSPSIRPVPATPVPPLLRPVLLLGCRGRRSWPLPARGPRQPS